MLVKTEEIIHTEIDFLPLKSYTNIVEGNALRIDWESVAPKGKVSYIMGNPPFVANTARVSGAGDFRRKKTLPERFSCGFIR